MNDSEERKKLIEEDQKFITIHPVDYSKLTNEQIKLRTEILELMFKRAYEEQDDDEMEDL